MPKQQHKRRAAVGHAPLAPAGRDVRWWWTAVLALLLVVLTLFVFAPVRHFDFVELDDPLYVHENPQVLAGLTPGSIVGAFTTGHSGYWIPAVWLSYMVDIAVFGPGPHGHHITNLVLHIVASLLLFGWLYRTTGSPWRSWVVAALFAVHPLHVESVAWITERKDVLSGVFWMLALWAYVHYVRRPGWRRYGLVASMFFLGLMSKPMVVTLPVVLLLVDAWPLRRWASRRDEPAARGPFSLVREKLPLAAVAVVGGVVTFVAQWRQGAVSDLVAISPGLRVANALVSYVEYLRMAVWPAGLAIFYPLPDRVPVWTVAGAIALLAGVTAAVLARWRRWPWLPVGWLWYLVTLVPVIGLVQAGIQARADRFMYLPAIGLFVMATWGVAELVPPRRWRTVVLATVAAGVVAACALAARAQVGYWEDSVSLFTRASVVDLNQDEYTAHMQLGVVLRSKGRLAEAAVHFTRAIRLKREAADPHVELGLTLSAQGQADAAVAEYAEALRLEPGRPDVHNNLGALLTDQGKFDDAVRELREAVRINPNLEEAHVNLGLALVKAGRVADSVTEFREALRINPGNALARRAVDGLTAAKR